MGFSGSVRGNLHSVGRRRKTIVCPTILLLSSLAFAQTAEVHRSAPGTRESGGFLPEGRFECRGETMLKLISQAYGVPTDAIAGGPDWLTTDRFDIAAKAPSRLATMATLRKMLQGVLADRFALAVHEDRKEMPVFLLKVGEGGPKLQPAAEPGPTDCPSVDGEAGLNHRACKAYTMADLSALLPQIAKNYVDRPVVDATGLDGSYDFPLDWMEMETYLGVSAVGRPTVSLFDALGKLGLKLEPGTGTTRAISIDHVNRIPKENGPAAPAEFDVAEVRRSKFRPQQQGLRALPDGQLEIHAYTLRELIMKAFDLTADRIAGGPKWLDTERFDVIAKSPDVMSPRKLGEMLQTLLARRFKLATHSQDQPVTVFALVPGKDNPKLQESGGADRSECKLRLTEKGRTYFCRNTTMAQLVDRLSDVAQAYLKHPLIDMTGLGGAYDFALTWTPLDRLPRTAARRAPSAQAGEGVLQASTPDGDITVFEAVERQLGLKLEERKHPMPVIVIDHVEHL
jgi:uncharacterized protein (TIGR03435 family)